MPIADENFDFLEDNETPRDRCHKRMSENLRQKIEELISEAERKGESKIPLGYINQFTADEVKIIFSYKTHVYHGFIHLPLTSPTHQAMENLLSDTATFSLKS